LGRVFPRKFRGLAGFSAGGKFPKKLGNYSGGAAEVPNVKVFKTILSALS
jgi:hypothetical protein